MATGALPGVQRQERNMRTYKIEAESTMSGSKKTLAIVVTVAGDRDGGTLRIPANGNPDAALKDAIGWISADIKAHIRVRG